MKLQPTKNGKSAIREILGTVWLIVKNLHLLIQILIFSLINRFRRRWMVLAGGPGESTPGVRMQFCFAREIEEWDAMDARELLQKTGWLDDMPDLLNVWTDSYEIERPGYWMRNVRYIRSWTYYNQDDYDKNKYCSLIYHISEANFSMKRLIDMNLTHWHPDSGEGARVEGKMIDIPNQKIEPGG
jgi:hypothetical protein